MYPLQIAKEIVNGLKSIRPRGYDYVCGVFYLRDEMVWIIFQRFQKTWFEFRKMVKHYETMLEHTNFSWSKKCNRPSGIPFPLRKLESMLRLVDDVVSDDLDILLYPHQPEETKRLYSSSDPLFQRFKEFSAF